MYWLLLGCLLAGSAVGAEQSRGPCPPHLGNVLYDEVGTLGDKGRANEILSSPEKFRLVYDNLRARYPDLHPDDVSCLLGGVIRTKLDDSADLTNIVEAYRNESDPSFSSMVLIGLFRQVSGQAVLKELSDRYQDEACASGEPAGFEQRVAGDALTCSSEKFREQFLNDILRRYGPGSSLHYKVEAIDCQFLVDRALAQTVFSTLPEKTAGRYQRRLSSLFR